MIEIILKASWKGIINKNTLTIPCSTNCYFSGQYSSCKIVPELLKVYYEVNISHIFLNPFWRYDSCLSFVMPFHDYNVMSKRRFVELCRKIAKFFARLLHVRNILENTVRPLLQNEVKLITKYDRFFITKQGKSLLQNSATFFITKPAVFVTKRGRYYKMRRLLQNAVQHLVQHVLIVFWITWFVIGDFIWN